MTIEQMHKCMNIMNFGKTINTVKIPHVHTDSVLAGSQFGLIAMHLIGVNSMPSNL